MTEDVNKFVDEDEKHRERILDCVAALKRETGGKSFQIRDQDELQKLRLTGERVEVLYHINELQKLKDEYKLTDEQVNIILTDAIYN